MNEVFEKILERIEVLIEESYYEATEGSHNAGIRNNAYHKVRGIVQEVAEEYKDGWIACSEKMTEDDSICIVTVEYTNNKTMVDYGWFDRKSVCWFVGMQEFRTSNILAWQPLPEPFKERD